MKCLRTLFFFFHFAGCRGSQKGMRSPPPPNPRTPDNGPKKRPHLVFVAIYSTCVQIPESNTKFRREVLRMSPFGVFTLSHPVCAHHCRHDLDRQLKFSDCVHHGERVKRAFNDFHEPGARVFPFYISPSCSPHPLLFMDDGDAL